MLELLDILLEVELKLGTSEISSKSNQKNRSITMKAATNTFFENINKPEFVTRLFDKVHDQKFFQKTVESGVGHDLSGKGRKDF